MSQLVVLKDKEFKRIINKIGAGGIVVLMPESLANKYGLQDGDERLSEYDASGDADLWIDIADHEDHYVFSWLKYRLKAEGQEYDGL